MARPRRADQSSDQATFRKLSKVIYGSQSICGICGRPVNFDKVFPDPWSKTIDHIIPVTKGGNPIALENLQLAHLQCNRIKSTRLLQPQIKEKSVSNRDLPLSFDWTLLAKVGLYNP